MTEYRDALSFLESVRDSKAEQSRLRERISELEARCNRLTTNLSGMPRGGGMDYDQQLAALADETARLKDELRRELNHARSVEDFLKRMPNRMYRNLLMRQYINCQTVPSIVNSLRKIGIDRSQRQVERMLNAARAEAERLWRETEGDMHDST